MQDQSVLVTIVIPTYSRNETLCKAIDSVLAQKYQNLEILVIDDNPGDSEWRYRTETLMEAYKNNRTIRYIKNKKNLGGAGARNEGIKAAASEYIAFLDDDEYYEERIEKQLGCFLNLNNSPAIRLLRGNPHCYCV